MILLIRKLKKEYFMNKFFFIVSGLFFLNSCGVKKVTNTDFSNSLKKPTEIINSVNSNSNYSCNNDKSYYISSDFCFFKSF